MKRVYIFINGINNNPSDADGWTDCAVTWTHIHTSFVAEKFEYKVGAIFRRIHQQQRSISLLKMMRYYSNSGHQIVLVAHSNGCDMIMRAKEMLNGIKIEQVHLYSPACDEDPDKNKFIQAEANGTIKRLFIYIAGRDGAMTLAKISQKLLGKFGLGFGSLGGMDPDAAKEQYGKDVITYNAGFKHSTWFERGSIFENTMREIMLKG